MSYFLLVLVTATMFVRPGEIVPAVQGWPIYNGLIVACMLASLTPLLAQLSGKSLRESPVTACVLAVWAAIVCSHLWQMRTWEARNGGFDFFKTVVFYMLVAGVIDSPKQLKSYLGWLFVFITALALIAVLSANHVIQLPGMEFLEDSQYDKATGEVVSIDRLQSTGIFKDPNDLAMILVAGVVIGLSFLSDPSAGMLRLAVLPAVGLFAFCIYRTQSRGGLMALVAALGTLAWMRYGWRRTLALGLVALPLLLVVAKGRMTDFDDALDEGTGRSRVELWSEGLQLFKQSPVFGIGQNFYAEQAGQVAHNSFVHAFTELGLFGGAAFFGAFAAAAGVLYRLWKDPGLEECDDLRRMLPFLAAIVAGFVVSMLSLSRNYVATPYLALGLVTATGRMAEDWAVETPLACDGRFLKRLAVGSVGCLAAIYAFILLTARH